MPRTATPKPIAAEPNALKAAFAEYPALDVLERRLLHPNDPGSLPILLQDDPDPCCGDFGHAYNAKPNAAKCPTCKVPFRRWYIRWVNVGEANRAMVIRDRGYLPVKVSELKHAEDVMGLNADTSAIVTRGDKKSEVLYKRPFTYHIEIKRKQLQQQNARRTPKSLKADLVASADRALGDEGAQTLHNNLHVEEFKTVRSTLADEVGAE